MDEHRLGAMSAEQHGVVSLAQLGHMGLSSSAVRARVATGRLHRVHRGVFAPGHAPLTREGRWMAAILAAGPDAVLSHRDAAARLGIRPSSAVKIEVSTPHRGRHGVAGLRLHRPRALPPGDIDRRNVIPTTNLARTLIDLSGVVPGGELRRAVHEAEVLRILDVDAVLAAADRARGRRGIGVLRDALASPSPPTRSELEHRFAELLRELPVATPAWNTRVDVGPRLVEVDVLWPSVKLVVELDGRATHLTRRQWEEDHLRDSQLLRVGYRVLRLTWRRITGEPEAVCADIVALAPAQTEPVGSIARPSMAEWGPPEAGAAAGCAVGAIPLRS